MLPHLNWSEYPLPNSAPVRRVPNQLGSCYEDNASPANQRSNLLCSGTRQVFRYPSVIQNFVKTWAELTFDWDNKIPGTNDTDSGIKVNSKRVSTSSYFASLLLEPNFGKASLPDIAELVPNKVFTGQLRATVIISFLSEPREVRPGEWEIDMIATRLLVDRTSGIDERIPFNRTFRIKAVEIQTPPLGSQASAFEQKVYELRSAGLEINKITEFKPN